MVLESLVFLKHKEFMVNFKLSKVKRKSTTKQIWTSDAAWICESDTSVLDSSNISGILASAAYQNI